MYETVTIPMVAQQQNSNNSLKIMMTHNYDQFDVPIGQRPIDRDRLQTIVESMATYGFIPGYHILVNGRMEVIDGQHRLEAAKLAHVPVYYSIEEVLRREDVPVFAGMAKGWKSEDFLESYVSQGLEEYIKFKNFMQKYQFSASVCLSILGKGKNPKRRFVAGTFVCDNVEFGELVGERTQDFARYCKFYHEPSFVRAISVLSRHADYDHKRMMHKLENQSSQLTRCVNKDQYVRLLQSIYNHQLAEKNRVAFVKA